VADRYDLKVARQGKDGKVWWTKIGVMFQMKERDGFNITLEALPLSTLNEKGELECRITAWEPYKEDRPRDNGRFKDYDMSQAPLPTSANTEDRGEAIKGADLDDKIPF